MSLEPAMALVVGLVVLHQKPGIIAVLGIGFVTAAGIGAARTGTRAHPKRDPSSVSLPTPRLRKRRVRDGADGDALIRAKTARPSLPWKRGHS